MGTRSSENGTRVSTAVLDAVVETAGTDRLDLPPLYDAIDTEALDRIIASFDAGEDVTEHVTFRYAGYRVTVTGDDVTVTSRE